MHAVVWTREDDHYWGPFTYARERRENGRDFGIVLTSGKGDDDDSFSNGCYVRIHLFGHTLCIVLPAVIKPARVWHTITTEPTRSRLIAEGRKPGYWDSWARDYGFCFVDGALHYDYGVQTHDSDTDKSGVWFLPWRQTRTVRHSLYDHRGELFAHLAQKPNYRAWPNRWAAERAIEEACPSVSFEFDDFDGERITVKTRIDEREWRVGTGWFTWLSLIRPSRIGRSLDLRFGSETGKRKGSWKGGTVGHSINMLPGELHEGAFRRYCVEHDMKFIGLVIIEKEDRPKLQELKPAADI